MTDNDRYLKEAIYLNFSIGFYMKKSFFFLSLSGVLFTLLISSCGEPTVKPLDTTVFKNLKFHFEDKDPAKNLIQGDILLDGASAVTEVKEYIIYWGNRSSSSGQSQQLVRTQKPSKNILASLEKGTPIKEDYLLLYFKGADGTEHYSQKFIKIKDLAIQPTKKKDEPIVAPVAVETPVESVPQPPVVAPVSPQIKTAPSPSQVDTPVSEPVAVTLPEVSTTPTESHTAQPMVILIKNILFEFDRSSLSQEYSEHLIDQLSDIEDKESIKLRIEGHADERGSNEYNLALGEKRAYAVKKFLITLGFSEENIELVSFGEEKPVSKGHDESSWSKNRRAVTEVKPKDQ